MESALRIFLEHAPTGRDANPIMRYPLCPPSLHRTAARSRNINRVPIGCGSRHPLRTDYPLADHHRQGNLSLSASTDLTWIAVTCANILPSHCSTARHRGSFIASENTLLPCHCKALAADERGTNAERTRKKFIRIPSATVYVTSAIFCGQCFALTSSPSVLRLAPIIFGAKSLNE